MARDRTAYRCEDCGGTSLRWTGRCPSCGTWNAMVAEPLAAGAPRPGVSACHPVLLAEIDSLGARPTPTGVGELDRVLGGGLLPGSATLIGGEPGVGKSTLLLQALSHMAGQGCRCLLVSAEESPAQVRSRAQRMGAVVPGLWVVGETSLAGVETAVRDLKPHVLVVDSVQTVWDPDIDAAPGSLAQVRGCAHRLVAAAKADGPATVLVGHVTKEGAIAGPRVLEHLVDTVLSFEGERHHALRLLRAVKHRFGPTGELGLFEMRSSGLQAVEDPGSMFLADRRRGIPGSVVFPHLEGQRPILVEIQALVGTASTSNPRRSASGFDSGRLSLLLAVLERRAGIDLGGRDVYVSVVGGVRISDPGADLPVCLAVASAATGCPIDDDLVVIGEVGLAGEVRQVAGTARRLAESCRLGFSEAVIPPAPDLPPIALAAHQVRSLPEALDQHLRPPVQAPRLRALPGPA